jgi:hypothetical protein
MSRSLGREKIIGPDGKVQNPFFIIPRSRSDYVKKIDDELKKTEPQFKVILDYYFDHFDQIIESSNGCDASTYYSAFVSTLREYFFPDNVTLWHLNGRTCEDRGKIGDHQKYRDFLCYIVRNADKFNALEYEKLTYLLMRILEEEAMSRVTFISLKGNEDLPDIFYKNGIRDKRDGKYKFCKGNNTSARVAFNGLTISNTKTNAILVNAKNRRFSHLMIEAADNDIQTIIGNAEAARRIRENERRQQQQQAAAAAEAAHAEADAPAAAADAPADRGMEAAEGGRNRSRRAPIRRKSANRRTPRRRNNTRKYCKK